MFDVGRDYNGIRLISCRLKSKNPKISMSRGQTPGRSNSFCVEPQLPVFVSVVKFTI